CENVDIEEQYAFDLSKVPLSTPLRERRDSSKVPALVRENCSVPVAGADIEELYAFDDDALAR
ncbi:unnamed protein product, partial [Polarella glacialis]